MFKAILPAMIISIALSVSSSQSARASSLNLSQFKWKNRLLLLFTPNRDHTFFVDLHKQLEAQKAEVEDRDLVIFEILESGPSSINMDALDSQTTQTLREKFDIHPGEFTIILIGKDGGIKLNRSDQTQLEDVFGLIDSMPMRREEIRKKSQNP